MRMLRRVVEAIRTRDNDHGFSLTELAVAGIISSLLLGGMAVFLNGATETGTFTQGQSETLNDVRNAMGRIEKELRGADSITWCEPAGSCLQVGAQTPTGGFRIVRYTHAGNALLREEYNAVAQTWTDPMAIIERVTNTAEQKVFSCDTQSTLLRVIIDLHIEPTPRSDPNLNVQTSLRPRNFPSVATCP